MLVELIVLVAALAITWLVFNWLIKVVKTSLSTAISIAAIVLVLQLIFGINSGDIWSQILSLPETLWQLFNN